MSYHNTFRLTIAKVNEQLFSGDALSVTIPGTEGELTILANHEPLITKLKKGIITVQDGERKSTFSIEKGLLETSNGQTTILV